ncbi:MAG TPA: glycosyltransferase family 2 protein [Candidatus Brocadiia bacterium]|nr:glycosyltransferase family 2 protein [Candidatus Brocadiia bacterium]
MSPPSDNQSLPDGLSVIVPALNEQEYIAGAISNISGALEGFDASWEIILVDDGSVDDTGRIMDEASRDNPRIRVIHNQKNQGFGGAFLKGLDQATLGSCVMVPGDDSFDADSLRSLFSRRGRASVVIPYFTNTESRPMLRRAISRSYTFMMNAFFGYGLPYYNGPVIYPTRAVRDLMVPCSGFGYQAEIVIRLLRSGLDFECVGMRLCERKRAGSHALKLRNFIDISRCLVRLWFHEHRI